MYMLLILNGFQIWLILPANNPRNCSEEDNKFVALPKSKKLMHKILFCFSGSGIAESFVG